MALKTLKKCIQYGFLTDARQIIENVDINDILYDELNNTDDDTLPLLILCTLINNENTAYNLCVDLIEKGYKVNLKDINGLCALNYAIIFDRSKLCELFLKSFDFNLNLIHDCYKNSLLHYVFAKNNDHIINLFTTIYKKYYSWNDKILSNMKNCHGLSVMDLYNYYIDKLKISDNAEISKRKAIMRSNTISDEKYFKLKQNISQNRLLTASNNKRSFFRGDTISDSFGYTDECFFRNSNPIFIIKHLNQMYNSKLTIKTIALIDKNCFNSSLFVQDNDSYNNNNNKGFQMNMLYKIKKLNRIKSSINIPLKTSRATCEKNVFEQNKELINNYQELKKLKSQNYCWKNDVSELLSDYATLTTLSYRNSAAPIRNLTSLIEIPTIINNESTIKKINDETNSSMNTARSNIVSNQNEGKQKNQSNETEKTKNGFIKSSNVLLSAIKLKNQNNQ